eukprot:gene39514-53427_t
MNDGVVAQDRGESAIHPWMTRSEVVRELSKLLDEFFLHQDRVQVRVGRYHRLQEGFVVGVDEAEA